MVTEGYAPEQVRRAAASLPFGSLAARAYETLYGAAQWYRQNISEPVDRAVQPYQNRNTYQDWSSKGLQTFQNIPTEFAAGVIRSPAIIAETAGTAAIGSAFLARDVAKQGPAVFVTRAGQGLGMQYEQVREGLMQRPAGFLGEMTGVVLISKGAGKAAGVAAERFPIKVRTAEIPTGGMRENPSIINRIPDRVFEVLGKEKVREIPVTNRYVMLTAESPGAGPTSGRVIAGVARTVEGTAEGQRTTQFFRGSPAEITEKTNIAINTPLNVKNPQPWSKGQSIVMREHLARTASQEIQVLINEGQEIRHAVQSPGVRAAVDKQIQPFDLNLETFGGKGSAGNRAIVEVLSREKYKGRVLTGGSISQKAYVPEGAYRNVAYSDVDLWIKDKATARELYTDLTTELKKTGDVNLEHSHFNENAAGTHEVFSITGRQAGVRGIGAHLQEGYPQLEGAGRTVQTAYGGTVEITNPAFNLESKMSGAFEGIRHKPGGKTELVIDRAKDIPDVYSYSRQAAANVYDTELTADVLSVRSTRREAIAASYERMSNAARKYGLDLEKTRQGQIPEIPKNLKPSEKGTAIVTTGEKVHKTLTQEITRDVLKGNPRKVRAGIDVLGTRGYPGGPRGLGESGVLLPGRKYIPLAARRASFTDIYPAGRRYPAGRSGVSRAYPAVVLAAASQYPKGTYPAKEYQKAQGAGYRGRNYPARKIVGGTYPGGSGRYTGGGGGGGGPGPYPTGGGDEAKYPKGPYMGQPPYPKGQTPTETPPPTEIPRERTRTRTMIISAIPTPHRRKTPKEDLLIWQGEKERKTAPYLEEAPVASHLEMLKGITNAKRHRKNTGLL